jgi:hypothetical protein
MGHLEIVNHFFETYPPKEPDSEPIYNCPECFNFLSLALDSRNPEVVWTILNRKLANSAEINKACVWANSEQGFTLLKGSKPGVQDVENAEDIGKLLTRYGTFSSPAAPHDTRKKLPDQPNILKKEAFAIPRNSPTPNGGARQNNHRPRGRGRGRGRGAHHGPPTQ